MPEAERTEFQEQGAGHLQSLGRVLRSRNRWSCHRVPSDLLLLEGPALECLGRPSARPQLPVFLPELVRELPRKATLPEDLFEGDPLFSLPEAAEDPEDDLVRRADEVLHLLRADVGEGFRFPRVDVAGE